MRKKANNIHVCRIAHICELFLKCICRTERDGETEKQGEMDKWTLTSNGSQHWSPQWLGLGHGRMQEPRPHSRCPICMTGSQSLGPLLLFSEICSGGELKLGMWPRHYKKKHESLCHEAKPALHRHTNTQRFDVTILKMFLKVLRSPGLFHSSWVHDNYGQYALFKKCLGNHLSFFFLVLDNLKQKQVYNSCKQSFDL